MNASKFKDVITTICGIIMAIGLTLIPLIESATITVGTNVKTLIYVAVALAGGIIGYFTGKKPDGTVLK